MIVLDWNRLKLIFGDLLSPSQIEGINSLIKEITEYGLKDKNAIAYILATCVYETQKKFIPNEEAGDYDYFEQMYGIEGPRSAIASRMKNTEIGDGAKYRKRGVIGLLGKKAYEDMGIAIGINLVDNPDKVLELPIAYKIVVQGMMRGLFTGVGLQRYISNSKVDFTNARRTINGTDNAKRIALMAEQLVSVIKEV